MANSTVKLPAPPPEVPVCRSLDKLAPKFRAKVERAIARMRAAGYDAMVYETTRTRERQLFLYGFGRLYDDGRGIVTHSRTADDTWHFYGLAVDIVSASKLWDASDSFWRTLEGIAEEEGLTSGSDWDRDRTTAERFKDAPHVQWFTPGMRRSPSDNAAILARKDGGVVNVWTLLGAA